MLALFTCSIATQYEETTEEKKKVAVHCWFRLPMCTYCSICYTPLYIVWLLYLYDSYSNALHIKDLNI